MSPHSSLLRSVGPLDHPAFGDERDRWRFWSFRARIVLAVVWLASFGALLWGGAEAQTRSAPYLIGLAVGVVTALGLMAFGDRRARRRAADALPPDDDFDA